jgi:hypothetical protein
MPKEKLTLSVDKEVVEKAKKLGLNISELTEKVLTGYTSAERPDGSLYDAYKQLFDSILPLLKEFDCSVKISEYHETFPTSDTTEETVLLDEVYLTANGSYHVEPEDTYFFDIKKIDPAEFLSPEKILSNLVNELARNEENRKEKMSEILMAKRIIDAMSETLLKKQSTKQDHKQ